MVYGFKFIEATKGSIILFLKIPITLILSPPIAVYADFFENSDPMLYSTS